MTPLENVWRAARGAAMHVEDGVRELESARTFIGRKDVELNTRFVRVGETLTYVQRQGDAARSQLESIEGAREVGLYFDMPCPTRENGACVPSVEAAKVCARAAVAALSGAALYLQQESDRLLGELADARAAAKAPPPAVLPPRDDERTTEFEPRARPLCANPGHATDPECLCGAGGQS